MFQYESQSASQKHINQTEKWSERRKYTAGEHSSSAAHGAHMDIYTANTQKKNQRTRGWIRLHVCVTVWWNSYYLNTNHTPPVIPPGIQWCSSPVVHPDRRWTRLTADPLDQPSGHQAGGYRSRRGTGPGGPGAEQLEEKLQKDRWVRKILKSRGDVKCYGLN